MSPRVPLKQRESNSLDYQGKPNRSNEKTKTKIQQELASHWNTQTLDLRRSRVSHPHCTVVSHSHDGSGSLSPASGCLSQVFKHILGVKTCLLCGHLVLRSLLFQKTVFYGATHTHSNKFCNQGLQGPCNTQVSFISLSYGITRKFGCVSVMFSFPAPIQAHSSGCSLLPFFVLEPYQPPLHPQSPLIVYHAYPYQKLS